MTDDERSRLIKVLLIFQDILFDSDKKPEQINLEHFKKVIKHTNTAISENVSIFPPPPYRYKKR